MPKSLNQLLADPFELITVNYVVGAVPSVDDATGGRPIRLHRIMLGMSYGGHFIVYDSLTAGSGSEIHVISQNYYGCQLDFGPSGIHFDALSYTFGYDPTESGYPGNTFPQYFTYYSGHPNYDETSQGIILYRYDD